MSNFMFFLTYLLCYLGLNLDSLSNCLWCSLSIPKDFIVISSSNLHYLVGFWYHLLFNSTKILQHLYRLLKIKLKQIYYFITTYFNWYYLSCLLNYLCRLVNLLLVIVNFILFIKFIKLRFVNYLGM